MPGCRIEIGSSVMASRTGHGSAGQPRLARAALTAPLRGLKYEAPRSRNPHSASPESAGAHRNVLPAGGVDDSDAEVRNRGALARGPTSMGSVPRDGVSKDEIGQCKGPASGAARTTSPSNSTGRECARSCPTASAYVRGSCRSNRLLRFERWESLKGSDNQQLRRQDAGLR